MADRLRALWKTWQSPMYQRRRPLILINGLAEQAESWFTNVPFWGRSFDIHRPNILAYDGPALHRRLDEGLPIDVDYLVEQLHLYLESFVQAPPYHLVASSLGGKVAVEYALRYPDEVDRVVLLCPSGMGDEERLPIVEGVRRSDLQALVESVFFDPRRVDLNLVDYYRRQFANRRWRTGLLRTIRGTMDHTVGDRLGRLTQPTLLVAGQDDRIVDPRQAEQAAQALPNGQFLLVPCCGHAPQLEKPRLINRLVRHFLTEPPGELPPRLARHFLPGSSLAF